MNAYKGKTVYTKISQDSVKMRFTLRVLLLLLLEREIKGRLQRYFAKPLNGEAIEDPHSSESEDRERHLDPRVCGLISKNEIKEALKKMTKGKAEGPD